MSDDYLKKCIELASNCTEFFDPPTASDWDRLEEELGLVFPESHKEFVNAFGSGYFGHFILWNPAGKGRFEFTKDRLLHTTEAWVALNEMELKVWPQDGGIVFVGKGTASHGYALEPNGQHLQPQLIEVDLGGHLVTKVGMGISEFLYLDFTKGFHDVPRQTVPFCSTFFEPFAR